MGKVRAKTLGDQEAEQKERDEAEARRQAKIAAAKTQGQKAKIARLSTPEVVDNGGQEAAHSASSGQAKKEGKVKKDEESRIKNQESSEENQGETVEKPDEKKLNKTKSSSAGKKEFAKKDRRSENWKKAAALVEKGKTYSLLQGLELLDKTHLAKFDETVELHINTTQSLTGSMQLPHGSGKSTRVAILAPSKDAVAAETLLKEIAEGKITFDVLVATPDAMPRLAKVARILGPKGLMPNPKTGTVTPNPEAVAKKYEGGHVTFKTEAKSPVLHLTVGKLSFGKEKLAENIEAAFKAVEPKNMRKVVLKSTMSPGIRISI